MSYLYEGLFLLAVFSVLNVVCFYNYYQLTSWLQINQSGLWQQLGGPKFMDLFFFGINFNFGLGKGSRPFLSWVVRGQYKHTDLPTPIVVKLDILRFAWGSMLFCFIGLLIIVIADVLEILGT